MVFVSFTSCIWILVYSLIAFSNVHALGVMIIASVAQSFNAMPFTCSIPLLVPDQTNIGLVFGVWKAFNNAGSVIIDIVAGRLQDITPDGGYSKVMAFFITMKAMEVCWGAFYGLLDRKYLGGVLTMSEHQRHIVEKTVDLKKVPGRRPYPFATWFGLGLLFSAGVTAWVLYIKYSI
ncbi:hypothetical protein QCA50_006154 [Cerrena zonata]|uniref:Uncharacterized protein n=1 Tax=Cerrena zonata TaxID=2478898 RepID=A0AAW0GNE4_9APHY